MDFIFNKGNIFQKFVISVKNSSKYLKSLTKKSSFIDKCFFKNCKTSCLVFMIKVTFTVWSVNFILISHQKYALYILLRDNFATKKTPAKMQELACLFQTFSGGPPYPLPQQEWKNPSSKYLPRRFASTRL